MTYGEQDVATMALTNISTSLHVLSTLDIFGESVYPNAHLILIENSIGAIADRLTDAEDGAMGSSIMNAATILVQKCGECSSDNEGIKENAIAAIGRLRARIIKTELDAEKLKKEPC